MRVSPANEQERAWDGELAEAAREATGELVDLAYLDQGCTGSARPKSLKGKRIV